MEPTKSLFLIRMVLYQFNLDTLWDSFQRTYVLITVHKNLLLDRLMSADNTRTRHFPLNAGLFCLLTF